jgi:hypothetical protein
MRGIRALAVAAILVVAVGCGGDDDDDDASSASATTTTTATTETSVTSDEISGYTGLTVEEAGAQADEEGRPWRVVKEDGKELAVTLDYNEQRLNFEVEDGVVTAVTTG